MTVVSFCRLAVLVLCAVRLASADVTLRYSLEIKPGAMLPPHLAEKMLQQTKAVMPDSDMAMQLKGNRALSRFSGATSISDFDGAMITLLDEKAKKYATSESSAYLRQLAESQEAANASVPAEAREAMARMKTSSEVRKTGRSRTIRGIRASEIELAIVMEMPGAPSGPMRTVLSLWLPEKDEVDRSAPLRELAFFSQRAFEGTNFAGAIEKAFGQMPGMGNAIKKLIDETKDTGVVLELEANMYMPALAAALAQQAAKANPEVAKIDADAPFMTMSMKTTELSAAEVPASVFEIPRDYTAVEMSELLRAPTPGRQ